MQSWVEPYPKPIILNHDLNSEPMGRVMAARMDKEADGSSFVRLQIAITDPLAIQKVLDKRYLTGSVGGRAGKAVCSISGDDLAKETESGRPAVSKYKRGQVYKGKLAYTDMQDISFKEYSFVNQPADQKSSIRAINPNDGTPLQDSQDGWVAKSSAFVLHMDTEDIVSVEENESILNSMKKKESKPLYLHLKGAFLTALAIHESEDYNNNNNSLLSNENKDSNSYEENSNMKKNVKSEDILAAVEDLSNDLSAIASGSVQEAEEDPETAPAPEAEEVVEETPAVEAPEAPEAEESIKTEEEVVVETVTDSQDETADALKKANEKIAELEAQLAKDSSTAPAADGQESAVVPELVEELALEAVESANPEVAEENKVDEDSKVELTDTNVVSEQDSDDLMKKLHLLEEENQKLRSALHRTLVERVVDAKIAAGVESHEVREELIEGHTSRSASSLADSLRDLAKMPTAKNARGNMLEMDSEIAVIEGEGNVTTLGKDDQEKIKEKVINTPEQLFVDALMGRRKL